MKIQKAIVATFLMLGGALALNDPKAMEMINAAAKLHNVDAVKMESMESTVTSVDSQGTFNQWLYRYDPVGERYFARRNTVASASRGVTFEQAVRKNMGEFWVEADAWMYTRKIMKLDSDNITLLQSELYNNILALKYRYQLTNVKIANASYKFKTKTYTVVSYQHKDGLVKYMFFSKDGKLAGVYGYSFSQNKPTLDIFDQYQTVSGVLVPQRMTSYAMEMDGEKLVQDTAVIQNAIVGNVRFNVKFSDQDFQLKVPKKDPRGGANNFGMVLTPASEQNFTGARVIPAPLRDPALKAGVSYGDEIIKLDGQDVSKMDYITLEGKFWEANRKQVKLVLKDKNGKLKTVTINR